MNPFVISQTYSRKAELISKFIVTSATICRSINDHDVLVGLRLRINQKIRILVHTRQLFIETKDEIVGFTSENNTDLTWEKVFGTLIDIQNSSNNLYFP